jgi:hypothetical protein
MAGDPRATPTGIDDVTSIWLGHDGVIHLREWASETVHPLSAAGACIVGSAPPADVRLIDPRGLVSRRHARIVRAGDRWWMEDLGSKNGLSEDHEPSNLFPLVPGLEVGIGSLTLVAENQALVDLRRYLARVLGWDAAGRAAIDLALQEARRAAIRRVPLMLTGRDDLVGVARQIHRRTMRTAAPFVLYSPQVRERDRSLRITTSCSEAEASELGAGGTVCVREELPAGLAHLIASSRARQRTQLIICATATTGGITVPSLAERSTADRRRIVIDYALDAIHELEASPQSFTEQHLQWATTNAPSFADIEITTLRLVARNHAGSTSAAAKLLGISHVALRKWLRRRQLL